MLYLKREDKRIIGKMHEITFIIKTFERPYCLRRLLRSIRHYYPNAIILIGDDSKKPCRNIVGRRDQHTKVFELPYDSGISYGRNELVRNIKTEYFVLLDDDFEFDENTDIEKGLRVLKEKGLDIVGGYFRNYPEICSFFDVPKYLIKLLLKGVQNQNYIGYINYSGDELRIKYYTTIFPTFKKVDIVHNFFIARTDAIRDRCLWDEELKVREHTPFFLKAKMNGLRVGFTNTISVKHKPIRIGKYKKYRDRDYSKERMKLYGIKRFVFSIDDGPQRIVEYSD